MVLRYLRRFGLFATALLGCLPAQAAPVLLAPSTPWHLDYSADSCRLDRTFGADSKQVLLIIDAFAPVGQIAVQVIGKPVAGNGDLRQPVTFGFGPDIPLLKSEEVLSGTVGPKEVPMLFLGQLDLLNRRTTSRSDMPVTPAQVAAVSAFELRMRMARLTLQTGSFQAPMEAMRACTDDLVRSWGLDPAQQARRRSTPEPIGNPGTWFTSSDYPPAALSWGESAIVQFRLLVDVTGKPTACHIQQATQGPAFVKLTCDLLMQRGRFKPAIGEDGQPIASYYLNSVHWLAPD